MTTQEIAARYDAKPSGKGKWLARCAAHDDRSPSLSIGEGRDGRTLLRCFAGCKLESIVRAAGLSVRDLFEGDDALNALQSRGRPNVADLYEALAIEERRYRERHRIEGLLRASEINSIRAAVAKRRGIELAPILWPLWEGGFGGRERDPAWPAIFEHALCVASVRLLGAPIALDETRFPPRSVLIEAEDLAALAMRDLEREARRRRSIAA